MNRENHYKTVPDEYLQTLLPFAATSVAPLGAHASTRQMWRVSGEGRSAIVVFHDVVAENKAFVGFGDRFRGVGVNTPEVYAVSKDWCWYAQQDLGDQTLFALLVDARAVNGVVCDTTMRWYREAVRMLPLLQIKGGAVVDYSLCYPHREFDTVGMIRDVEACKRDFLDNAGLHYSTTKFYQDGRVLVEWLGTEERNHFLHRDFQARNLMISDDELWVIDFQNGRRGPLAYDLVSLLFQAQARLSHGHREELLIEYLKSLANYERVNEQRFREYFVGFAVLRMIQVLGTYGREGLRGGKDYFRRGIPLALAELHALLQGDSLPMKLRNFAAVVEELREAFPAS